MSGSEPLLEPHDLRVSGSAAAAWVGAWLVTGEIRHAVWWGLSVTVVLIGMSMMRRSGALAMVGIALTGSVLVASLALGGLRRGLLADLAGEHAIADMTMTVTSDPRVYSRSMLRGTQVVVPVRVSQVTAHGESHRVRTPALLITSTSSLAQLSRLDVGMRIRAVVSVNLPHPGEGIAARLRLAGDVNVLEDPSVGSRLVNRLRSGLREAVARNPEAQAGLVPALVVGDVSRLPAWVSNDFKTTGLTHLTAVSGTNLTLLLAFVLTVVRRAGVRGRGIRIVGAIVVAFFIVLCRAEPSVLRAAAMGIIALAATGAADRSGGMRSLSVASLLLVLVSPWLSRSWGFALSVSASAGILILGSSWQRRMRRWAPGWLAEAICIPLSAQIATQPLVTYLSGSISMAGVAANAMAGPFVGPVTITGIVASFGSLVAQPLAGWVGFIAGWCAQPIIWIAHFFANLPSASWRWQVNPSTMMVLVCLCVGAAFIIGVVVSRRWQTVIFVIAIVVSSWRQPNPLGWPGDWRIVVCDVGQGDATVLRSGPGQGVLVDTGPEAKSVMKCLRALHVTHLPIVVITHGHSDHIGGLAGVVSSFSVGRIVTSNTGSVRRVLRGSTQPPIIEAQVGDYFAVGDITWTTIGPIAVSPGTFNADEGGESAAENNRSVVGLAVIGGLRVLLTGDVEPSGQEAIISQKIDMQVHVLRIPHHGSARQSPEFFARTKANIAIASAGKKNDYGHPAPRTIRLAQSQGMTVFSTHESGSIAVGVPRDGRVNVRTERR